MTRKLPILCDNYAGPMALRVHVVGAMRSSRLAGHFLDYERLFAADGPSTPSYAANALLPMSVCIKSKAEHPGAGADRCSGLNVYKCRYCRESRWLERH